MKTSKRLLSTLLAVLVVISAFAVCSVSASAATLKAPTGVKVVNQNHSLVISFKKVSGAKTYEIYKGSKQFAITNKTSIRDYSVTGGHTYSYKVRAINGTKKGAFSSTVKCCRVNFTVITSLTNQKNGVKLTWVKRTGADNFIVERATSGSFTKLATVTGLEYTDKTAVAGTTYSYRVTGYNNATKASSTVSVVESITRLQAVTGFTAVKTLDTRNISLKWAAATGAVSYNVYRQKCTDEDYVKIANVTAAAFVDTDIIANPSAYRYKVTAVKGDSESALSADRFVQTFGSTPAYFDDQRNYHVPLSFKVGDTYAEGKYLSDYYSFGGNYDVIITEGSDVISIDDNVITAKKAGTAKVTIHVTDAVKTIVDNQIKDDLLTTLTNRDVILEITVA